jgi:hypothetical protein
MRGIDPLRRVPHPGMVIDILGDRTGHATHLKNTITATSPTYGSVFLLSAAGGPMPQTREHVVLGGQVGAISAGQSERWLLLADGQWRGNMQRVLANQWFGGGTTKIRSESSNR